MVSLLRWRNIPWPTNMCIFYLIFDYRKKYFEDERTTSARHSMQKYKNALREDLEKEGITSLNTCEWQSAECRRMIKTVLRSWIFRKEFCQTRVFLISPFLSQLSDIAVCQSVKYLLFLLDFTRGC